MCSHCFSGKAISITYSECVSVAEFIQHAMCISRIVLSSVVCLAVPYFSTLSHKQRDFRKVLLNIKCVLRFTLQLFYETFFILRRIQQDVTINIHWSLHKVPIILVIF